MELGQLAAFIEVARQGSFSRAAEALFLTQPSITARIQSLERDVSERLFERVSGAVRLTDAGRAFLPHAQQALNAIQDGTDAIRGVREGNAGRLAVGTVAGETNAMLAAALKRFRLDRPAVDIRLTSGTSDVVLNLLLAGDVHLGIFRLTQHPQLESRPLYEFDLALAVHPEHPFVNTAPVTFAQAAREPFIVFDRDSYLYRLMYEVCLSSGVMPQSVIQANSLAMVTEMVASGLGIALLPAQQVAQDEAIGRLRRVEVRDLHQPAQRAVGLHTLKNRTLSLVVRRFVEIVTDEAIRLAPQAGTVP